MRIEEPEHEATAGGDDNGRDAPGSARASTALSATETIARGVSVVLERAQTLPSPQVMRSLLGREARFRAMRADHGMLTAADIARIRRSTTKNPAQLVNNLTKRYALAYEIRGRTRLYPAFQFDPRTGEPRDDTSAVVGLLRSLGRSDHSIITWLTTPNAYLAGGGKDAAPSTPIDALPAELDGVLYAARQTVRA